MISPLTIGALLLLAGTTGCTRAGFRPYLHADGASHDASGPAIDSDAEAPADSAPSCEPDATCDDHDPATVADHCDSQGRCRGDIAPVWPLIFDSSYSAIYPWVIRLDSAGNLYAAVTYVGRWNGAGYDAEIAFADQHFTSAGYINLALASFRRDGSTRWAHGYGDDGVVIQVQALSVEPDGTSTCGGAFVGTNDFGDGHVLSKTSPQAPLLLVHAGDGRILSATAYPPGNQNGQVHDIATSSQRFAISGVYGGNIDFGGGGIGQATRDDGYLALFDNERLFLWARTYKGSANIYATATAVAENGRAWAAGHFSDDIDFGSGTIAGRGGVDQFIVAHEADGSLRWGKALGSENNDGSPLLALAPDGTSYLAAAFNGAIALDNHTTLAPPAGSSDGYLAAFDENGALRWSQTWGGTAAESVKAIGLLPDGTIWVAGTFSENIVAGSFEKTSAGGRDAYLLLIEPEGGAILALETLASSTDLTIEEVVVDAAYATAWFSGRYTGTLELGGTHPSGLAFIYPLLITLP